jgi:hypothetical protein
MCSLVFAFVGLLDQHYASAVPAAIGPRIIQFIQTAKLFFPSSWRNARGEKTFVKYKCFMHE